MTGYHSNVNSSCESLDSEGKLLQPLPQVLGATAQVVLSDGRRIEVEAVARAAIEKNDIVYDAQLEALWLAVDAPRGLALASPKLKDFSIPLAEGWGPSLLLRVKRASQ